jgi:hypothetical protein
MLTENLVEVFRYEITKNMIDPLLLLGAQGHRSRHGTSVSPELGGVPNGRKAAEADRTIPKSALGVICGTGAPSDPLVSRSTPLMYVSKYSSWCDSPARRGAAALFVQPDPSALPLDEVVFDFQSDHGAEARESEHHQADESPIAQATTRCTSFFLPPLTFSVRINGNTIQQGARPPPQ